MKSWEASVKKNLRKIPKKSWRYQWRSSEGNPHKIPGNKSPEKNSWKNLNKFRDESLKKSREKTMNKSREKSMKESRENVKRNPGRPGKNSGGISYAVSGIIRWATPEYSVINKIVPEGISKRILRGIAESNPEDILKETHKGTPWEINEEIPGWITGRIPKGIPGKYLKETL